MIRPSLFLIVMKLISFRLGSGLGQFHPGRWKTYEFGNVTRNAGINIFLCT